MQINWDSFAVNNQDARGVRLKFEDLCRQIFANEYIDKNKRYRYLHANPNNPGLETEPIYDETNQRWIGFQAKYFDDNVDYSQIKNSAQKIIKYYKGRVDHVFLFSNKPISSTANGFLDTVKILNDNHITIELVTDVAILDLVRNKYTYLAPYYFGCYMLRFDWFASQAERMFDLLGERYSPDFNIDTSYSDDLSLFVHDTRAVEYMNQKKYALLNRIDNLHWLRDNTAPYLKELEDVVNSISEVDLFSLMNATKWCEDVKTQMTKYRLKLEEKQSDNIKKMDELNKQLYSATDKDNELKSRQRIIDLKRDNERIQELISLPDDLSVEGMEKALLSSDILFVVGRPGIGKTQLLAWQVKSLLEQNHCCLFLVAGIYYTNDPIEEQIMKNLQIDCSFSELVDILETIGERDNHIISIIIDAINETWNKKLWENGLTGIIEKVQKTPMVRLVISYRQEYEALLLSQSVSTRKKRKEFVTVVHEGFQDNSVDAVRRFLNHYSIPFSPYEYFGIEMTNPLFLKLYCKTYTGEEVDLPSLYERVIEQTSKGLYKTLNIILRDKGYTDDYNILEPLVSEISSYFIENDTRSICKEELMRLSYWNDYGLRPAPFVAQLLKERFLYDSVYEDKVTYYFAFDQMNDYYCAKAILRICDDKESVRRYLKENVLGIKDGQVKRIWDIALFVNGCALYAEKYKEECIDILEEIEDENDKWQVFSEYVRSFQWRNPVFLPVSHLFDYLSKYPCLPEDLFPVLIGNSLKSSHPLNADYLHGFLMRYPMNKRDSVWTIYINQLPQNESDRLIHLIEMYNKGGKLDEITEKQTELLLTLFAWLLTSSNRWLRDCTSKAMIEILKKEIRLCQVILKKFKDVNDPYVIQRLYGVVFGACSKRTDGDITELAEYVYDTVFDQEVVYPDILLRDYARDIIEMFLFENPEYEGVIIHDRIIPPYNSDQIPEIEDQHYLDQHYDGGMYWLISSMRFDGMGIYGDFGRYVFQAALRSFDVDDKTIFNYALFYILNDLGYSEALFGEYDSHYGRYNRTVTVKTERIGKKYQWIAMHNILARVSDHNKMEDQWNWPKNPDIQFEGAWNPYIRDFDPTLNQNFMKCDEAPCFGELDSHIADGQKEIRKAESFTDEELSVWIESTGEFLGGMKDTLILEKDGTKWVCLTKSCNTAKKNLSEEKLLVWSWLYAYYMTPKQADEFTECADNALSVITHNVASHHQTYALFNREYPWAPSCKEFIEYGWVDVSIKTGEKETVKEIINATDNLRLEELLRAYRDSFEVDTDEQEDTDIGSEFDEVPRKALVFDRGASEIQDKEVVQEREVEKEIGRILRATTDLLWEEEYDASKEETISRSVPCGLLLTKMNLRQLEADGFYYDDNGRLAAFDTDLTQGVNSVVVRKDIMDSFLDETGMKLVWLADAEKEIHAEGYMVSKWSDWEAVFVYEGDGISGDYRRIHSRYSGQ